MTDEDGEAEKQEDHHRMLLVLQEHLLSMIVRPAIYNPCQYFD